MPGVGFIGGRLSIVGGYNWPGAVDFIEEWDEDRYSNKVAGIAKQDRYSNKTQVQLSMKKGIAIKYGYNYGVQV